MHTSRLFSLRRSFRHGVFLALLSLLILSGLLGTTAILLKPPTADAQSIPVWCQNWDPNPANASDKQVETQVTYGDGSIGEIEYGYFNGINYTWANLAHGNKGDHIALIWTWTNNQEYQCGDSSGAAWAQVWSQGGDTWTAGVPTSELWGPFCINFIFVVGGPGPVGC